MFLWRAKIAVAIELCVDESRPRVGEDEVLYAFICGVEDVEGELAGDDALCAGRARHARS